MQNILQTYNTIERSVLKVVYGILLFQMSAELSSLFLLQ